MSYPDSEPAPFVQDSKTNSETFDASAETIGIKADGTALGETAMGQGEAPAVKKPLPTKKDFPTLGSGAFLAATNKVSWGPNMKPSASSSASESRSASNSASQSRSATPASHSAKPARSKTIQEAFSLDLQSQLSIAKPDFSRIVQSVKQSHNVSIESTLSKTSRTFLISGKPENVSAARREVVKKLTKPITTVLKVPSKTRSTIIGSGGKNIRGISDPLQVKIDIGKDIIEDSFDEDLDDYLVNVSIHGDLESVRIAQEKILLIVREDTKNASIKIEVPDKNLVPFVKLDFLSSEIVSHFDSAQGVIRLSGLRENVQAAKLAISKYFSELDGQIKTLRINIPTKFQFLIDDSQIKEKFNVAVKFSHEFDEEVAFVGPASKLEDAVSFARENSKKFKVESLEISKAHGKNLEHAKYVALYFEKYNLLEPIKDGHPSVRIALPSAQELINAESVLVRITSTLDNADELKAVRKDIINLVNEMPTTQVLIVDDLDYELYAKDIKHALLQQKNKAGFVQLGDLYPGDDRILIVAQLSDDDFRPSADELKQVLDEVNSALEPLRNKLANLSQEVMNVPHGKQDTYFKLPAITRLLIDEDIDAQGGHVQFKLHYPSADKLTIRGDSKAVKTATNAVESILTQDGQKFEAKFGVSANAVPRLIGTKGANLHATKEKFQCAIDVAPESDNNVTEVTVTGLQYCVEHAKAYLINESKKWADIVTKELNVLPKFRGKLIGSQGTYRNRLQTKYNVFIHFPAEDESQGVTIKGPSRGVAKAYEELKALLDFEIENGHASIIKVPTEHVPRIIGKGGDMINDIRAECGVELDFLQKTSDSKAVEAGEVELEITGSRQAIKEATQRVNEIIKEAADVQVESFEVNPDYIRDIVGAGGRVLKELISKAGGDDIRNKTVDIPDAKAQDKKIVIQGPQSFVQALVKEIKKIVEERENSIEKELEVPLDRVGALIGPGGSVRRQLESEFRVRLLLPAIGDKSSKVKVLGLPSNIAACEKKIFSEIIRDNCDVEIDVPASFHEFVSEKGAFIQRLRSDFSINVKFGNAGNKANKLARAKLSIPVERASGSEGEKIKLTMEENAIAKDKVEGTIPWRLSYEPVDLSDILSPEEQDKEPLPKKQDVLAQAQKLIEQRIELASRASTIGYLWSSKPQDFRKVVGPMGSHVKKIREASNTLISIPKKGDAVADIIFIRGTKEGVEKAADAITKTLKN
ncbi:LADA_0H12178g1_1 [Lachancea dasiensis]|uniref:LADA_0H12178g1_1 n=1 Tax=Lachancea dasiensis TaxID=1072105 RepID=A0A1G4K3Q4_9SACH|nr:LADA_0H12178g1_1 [Lachancea dasiensis]